MRTRTRGMIAIALAIAAAVAGTPATLAQAPQAPLAPPSSKGVVLKGRAPVSDELLRVKLPRPQEAVLSNGLRLIVLEDRRVPRITLQLLIPGAGGYYDPVDLPGLGNVTSAMMRDGTATRSSSQISEQLENDRGCADRHLRYVSDRRDCFRGVSHRTRGLTLRDPRDVLLNPSFPDDEPSRYKQRTRAGLLQQRSIAGFRDQKRAMVGSFALSLENPQQMIGYYVTS